MGDNRERGGVWDVRPPQFALGRRARAAALPQASQPAVPAPVRAPSPLLPRIASARNQHHAKGGERQRPLQAVEARLAMLEERMSNVDRENAFLRHTVDTLQARMSTELDAAKARMHKGMQDRLQTDVLAQSTGAMTGKVLKRVAQLENQMQRDGAALRRVEDQLRVGQAQGLQQGVGVGVGSSADAAASAQSAAQSASNAAKVAMEAHTMLAELRASMRAKYEGDLQSQARSRQQIEVLAKELQRCHSDINTITMQVAKALQRVDAVATTPGAAGGGAGNDAGAMVEQMAALNRHVQEQLRSLREDVDMKVAMVGMSSASAERPAGALDVVDVAEQVTKLASSVSLVQEELQKERAYRKESDTAHMQALVELRKSTINEKKDLEERMSDVLQQVGSSLSAGRQETQDWLQAAERGTVERHKTRVEEEGQAFQTIAARFEKLEAALTAESNMRQQESLVSAKATTETLKQLAQRLLDETQSRAAAVRRLSDAVTAVQEESASSVKTLQQITARDRDVLAELVSTEIDARVKRDEKTVSELNRYVQELGVALKKVREACRSETADVQTRMEELEEMLVQRLASTSEALQERSSKQADAATAKLEAMETQFHTVRESLQAAFREQAESTETSLRELEEQTKKSFETLEASLRASAQEEWQARDEQRAEMVATMEQNAASAADAISALQGVTAEDREHIQAALLEVDGRLSSRINDVQERLSEQVVKTAAQLTAAVEGIRASTTEASQQLDREQHRLAQDVDARLVVLQDNLVQATRSAERASQALAKELSNEVSNMESVVATARQDIDGGLEDVRDRLTEMYLRGVLSAAISDVEMRDIASEYSKSAMNFVLEDHRPMFSSIQADVEELKSRVLTQNETTVAAIQSTDRKAAAAHETLQHRLGVLLGDMEARLVEADTDTAERVASTEKRCEELASALESGVQLSVMNSVQQIALSTQATTTDLAKRIAAMESSMRDDKAFSEAAWQQTVSLAQAFEAGSDLPELKNMQAFGSHAAPTSPVVQTIPAAPPLHAPTHSNASGATNAAQRERGGWSEAAPAPTPSGPTPATTAVASRAASSSTPPQSPLASGPRALTLPSHSRRPSRVSQLQSAPGTPESQGSVMEYRPGPVLPTNDGSQTRGSTMSVLEYQPGPKMPTDMMQ